MCLERGLEVFVLGFKGVHVMLETVEEIRFSGFPGPKTASLEFSDPSLILTLEADGPQGGALHKLCCSIQSQGGLDGCSRGHRHKQGSGTVGAEIRNVAITEVTNRITERGLKVLS